MNKADKAYAQWIESRKKIRNSTSFDSNETILEQEKRKKKLLSNITDFTRYYFPQFMQNDFGWFHLKAFKDITSNKDEILVAEWPREHAKSVFFDIIIPVYLKCKGELTGMMIGSANHDKAKGLLSDIQAQFMDNQRLINDYGKQVGFGSWTDGYFATSDGIGFWAFGRGQSPRGTRENENRPNYGVIDDIDDKKIIKNEELCQEAAEWVIEDFYGAMPTNGSRLVIVQNRTAKRGVFARLIEDEHGRKLPGRNHIRVFAIEDEKHNASYIGQPGARPAWKERYTLQSLGRKFEKMGYRSTQREFFHNPISEGTIFKHESISWIKPLHLSKYEQLVSYCDPSFRDTKKNDYKAIVLVGKKGKYFDVLYVFAAQTTAKNMVEAHYDIHAMTHGYPCKHYMEANFIQDLLIDEYDNHAETTGYHISIRPDKRSKENKEARIENLSPLFERGFIRFSEEIKNSPGMSVLIDQLMAFPQGAHDDAPDALEGAIWLLNKGSRSNLNNVRTGSFSQSNKRRF